MESLAEIRDSYIADGLVYEQARARTARTLCWTLSPNPTSRAT